MKYIKNLLSSAVVAAVVGGLAGYFTALHQAREGAVLQLVTAFSMGSDEMSTAMTDFIASVGNNTGLSESRRALRIEIVKQIQRADSLRPAFKKAAGPEIESYQTALEEFASTLNEANSPTTMGDWYRKFDRVTLSKKRLREVLHRSVNLSASG